MLATEGALVASEHPSTIHHGGQLETVAGAAARPAELIPPFLNSHKTSPGSLITTTIV